MNFLKFNNPVIKIAQGLAQKEIKLIRFVATFQNLFIIAISNRRQLIKVTKHDKLNTAKWPFVMAIMLENCIGSVKHVTANHAYFINNHDIYTTKCLCSCITELI